MHRSAFSLPAGGRSSIFDAARHEHSWPRFKACADLTCGSAAFYDATKNRSGRWLVVLPRCSTGSPPGSGAAAGAPLERDGPVRFAGIRTQSLKPMDGCFSSKGLGALALDGYLSNKEL